MKPFALISDLLRIAWYRICWVDSKLVTAFARLKIVVVMLLVWPIGLCLMLLGRASNREVKDTFTAISALLKKAFEDKPAHPEQGGL